MLHFRVVNPSIEDGMANDGSVSQWIADLKDGDTVAASDLWHRYFERLLAVAKRRLNTRQRRFADEEDVVISVFDTLCRGAKDGRFQDIQNRNDLWRMLVVIVRRKVIDRHRRETAKKRGGATDENRLVVHSMDDLVGEEPTPHDLLCMEEEFDGLMASLEQDVLKQVAQMKLEGYRNSEIAEKLCVSVRTIQRKLDLIETVWMSSIN